MDISFNIVKDVRIVSLFFLIEFFRCSSIIVISKLLRLKSFTKIRLTNKIFSTVEMLVFLGTWMFSSFVLGWWNNHRKEIKHRCPPSFPSLPLVGSLPFLRGFKNIADFFMRKADELGPAFTFRAGNQ